MPGENVPPAPDLVRMRAERTARVHDAMANQGVDALLLLGNSNVQYASGAFGPTSDASRAGQFRPVALLLAGDAEPHVFTPYPEGLPPELPADHRHGPVFPEIDEGVAELAERVTELAGAAPRLALDDMTAAMFRARDLLPVGGEPYDAGLVMAPAKVCKTDDELACIRQAQYINERAMHDVQEALAPGLRQCDLSGLFLERIFDYGATANCIDPIWQVMPARKSEIHTVHGDLAFPLVTTDRILREGDLIWNDTGIAYEGYASDFGRTWIVAADPQPTPAQRALFERWRAVVDAVLDATRPGATGRDLTRVATEVDGGGKPWLEHFYLIHGVGTDSAEMPLIGTDLGDDFDESIVLAPGMVMVLEPAVWEDDVGGYRGEEIVAVTEDGWTPLSDYPYTPFT
jgi:Xaa-Pro aminopeptidase